MQSGRLGDIPGAYAALIETATEADVTASRGFLAMTYVTMLLTSSAIWNKNEQTIH